MRLWTENGNNQYVYIDVGAGNEVYNFMVKNSIFVEKVDGDVLTFNTSQFSLGRTANALSAIVDLYVQNGWEVTEDVKAIEVDFRKRAKEERERREDEKLRRWFEEQEKNKNAVAGVDRPYYKVVVRNGGLKYRVGTI